MPVWRSLSFQRACAGRSFSGYQIAVTPCAHLRWAAARVAVVMPAAIEITSVRSAIGSRVRGSVAYSTTVARLLPQARRAGRARRLELKAMKTRYAEIPAYVTKDGSEIRELMHPAQHGNRLQSLAEATVAPGGPCMKAS